MLLIRCLTLLIRSRTVMGGSVALTLIGVLTAAAAEPTPEQLEFFEKQVRPILVQRCYECHNSKLDEPKGNLRVDSHAAILKGGDTGPGVVPGNTKESLVIDAVNYGDLYQMPPKSKMPDAEIAVLTRWVEEGAYWPAEAEAVAATNNKAFDLQQRKADHWCWQPIVDRPPPAVKNAAWPKAAIDNFILAKLESEGLSPAPAADRRTLVRRAYFDLIGLPPSPEEMTAALADQSPQWFAQLVDKLLESPHFGERWGRHWLDLVRYAESRGHEFDYAAPNAFQYRDYVIRALNADVPYDQFVTEHIAGDLLAQPRKHPTEKFNESILGTGFWFLGEWVHSPVDIRKDETDRYDNMVDVFSKTFLGVTVACARCHDHKFDAISQKDYYALYGFLQSSSYRLARIDTLDEHQAIAEQAAELEKRHRQPIAAVLAAQREPVASHLADYLLAASQLMHNGVQPRADAGGNVAADSLNAADLAKIDAAAAERKLDRNVLINWLGRLTSTTAKSDPFYAWAFVCRTPADSVATELSKFAAEQQQAITTASEAKSRIIVDYATASADQWLPDGVAFGLSPVKPGELTIGLDPAQAPLSIATYGAARRDPLWKGLTLAPNSENDVGRLGQWVRAGQAIKSPTFKIEDGRVHVLSRGAGHIYANVASHAMIEGPLHGQLIRDIAPGLAAHWTTLDLRTYADQRMHLEFSPRGDEDFEVLCVAEGEQPPAEKTLAFPSAAPLADKPEAMVASLAELYQKQATAALAALTKDELAGDAVQANLAVWIMQHDKLFLIPGAQLDAQQAEVKRLADSYRVERQKLAATIRRDSHLAMAMWEGNAVNENLLIRGNSHTVGAEVPRRTLEALDSQPWQLSGSGRLQLAASLLSKDNPLTSRVMANRVWHHLFGRGLSASVDNFGVLGQAPTHPELLDHLAVQFRTDGWSVKRLIRTIMLSSSYQMASGGDEMSKSSDNAKLAESHDPQNLLWHRQSVKRLEGEAIRDSILAVSGRLDRNLFGPAVPVYLTAFMQGRGRPGSGPLDGSGRRSVYISIRRNFLSPMMLAFDTPIPFNTVGRRNVSNVPAQALILMNDPLVVEQAGVWAQSVLAVPELSAEQRVDRLYNQAFGRSATTDEVAAAQSFLESQSAEYGLTAEQAQADPRVWTDLCHVLYNVKEFVFVR